MGSTRHCGRTVVYLAWWLNTLGLEDMMGTKSIKQELLWESICWVFYQYTKHSPADQFSRPLRAYQDGDGAAAAHTIKTIRQSYYYQIKAFKTGVRASRPNFERTKELVVESLKLEHGWSETTRNLYSSVAATYITWDYQGQSDVSRRKLSIIVAYGNLFFRPGHKATAGTQGVLI